MLRWKLSMLLSLSVVLAGLAPAQSGSMADLRADEQRLRQQQLQLDQDRERLRYDRGHRASRSVINADELRIRTDRATIRSLKADIKHDRRLRRRYRQGF